MATLRTDPARVSDHAALRGREWFVQLSPAGPRSLAYAAVMRFGACAVVVVFLGSGCGDDGGGFAPPDASADAPGSDVPTCRTDTGWWEAPRVRGGAIQETAVVALDNKIYVLGGFDASLAVVTSVRIFDTEACTWSDGPALPRPLHHANAAVVGETIYVLGGMDGLNFTPLGDVWAWKPKTDAAWSAKTSMPAGSARGSAFVGAIGDVIYVAGGLRSGAVTTVSSYSTTNDTWDTNLPPLPQARDHGCGAVFNGKLYAVGGRAGSITSQSPIVYEYTPGGAWVEKAPMPTPRGGTACGVIDGRIIVVGGEGNAADPSGVFPQVESYAVQIDHWSISAPMKTPRHGTGAAAAAGVLYVPGGATKQAFGAVDTHEALRP